ncbi:MAG: hypothetical protein US60_C0004G0023 [Microgenomates group bacterium GW2011_GWC1_37_8]|uniref:Uncharacterized protein n=1 Tax=Candidatus Woesebacteria bacterium GW2011_GWB1_38_8 TaxID=1618570 RepID=A0A0G0P8S9_9BACT|nr:MAG: hypothetical protein US60_C0004G0023 [Microgenomates group bacterium GW2011_GWC1_37_8]KKQ85711.1 MAG: hypothetical protein UT08_C0004G0023 [Candidatus Woesebacteria bacterium GW2011_GWB1_38_8]
MINQKKIKGKKTFLVFRKHIVFWLILIAFISLQVFIAIQVSTKGAGLAVLENNKNELLAEQQKLKGELIGANSITVLAEKAQEFGYKKIDKTFYIKIDENFAALKK